MSYRPEELAGCARREVRYRRRVYARLVAEGKMGAQEAQREIELMAEIAEWFEAQIQPELRLE